MDAAGYTIYLGPSGSNRRILPWCAGLNSIAISRFQLFLDSYGKDKDQIKKIGDLTKNTLINMDGLQKQIAEVLSMSGREEVDRLKSLAVKTSYIDDPEIEKIFTLSLNILRKKECSEKVQPKTLFSELKKVSYTDKEKCYATYEEPLNRKLINELIQEILNLDSGVDHHLANLCEFLLKEQEKFRGLLGSNVSNSITKIARLIENGNLREEVQEKIYANLTENSIEFTSCYESVLASFSEKTDIREIKKNIEQFAVDGNVDGIINEISAISDEKHRNEVCKFACQVLLKNFYSHQLKPIIALVLDRKVKYELVKAQCCAQAKHTGNELAIIKNLEILSSKSDRMKILDTVCKIYFKKKDVLALKFIFSKMDKEDAYIHKLNVCRMYAEQGNVYSALDFLGFFSDVQLKTAYPDLLIRTAEINIYEAFRLYYYKPSVLKEDQFKNLDMLFKLACEKKAFNVIDNEITNVDLDKKPLLLRNIASTLFLQKDFDNGLKYFNEIKDLSLKLSTIDCLTKLPKTQLKEQASELLKKIADCFSEEELKILYPELLKRMAHIDADTAFAFFYYKPSVFGYGSFEFLITLFKVACKEKEFDVINNQLLKISNDNDMQILIKNITYSLIQQNNFRSAISYFKFLDLESQKELLNVCFENDAYKLSRDLYFHEVKKLINYENVDYSETKTILFNHVFNYLMIDRVTSSPTKQSLAIAGHFAKHYLDRSKNISLNISNDNKFYCDAVCDLAKEWIKLSHESKKYIQEIESLTNEIFSEECRQQVIRLIYQKVFSQKRHDEQMQKMIKRRVSKPAQGIPYTEVLKSLREHFAIKDMIF